MCAIEDADLSCPVEGHVVCPDHVHAGCSCRKLILVCLSVALNDPEKEDLRAVEEVVLVADLLADRICLSPRITRNDSVNKAVAEITGILKPVDESLLETPLLGVLEYDSLEVVSVLVDELTGNCDDTL